VLPTPPTSATPILRLGVVNDAESFQSTRGRPSTPGRGGAQPQPTGTPKLNIGRFSKQNKTQKTDSLADSHATHSPASSSKSRGQAQVQDADTQEEHHARPSSVFGPQTGLLPRLARHTSPASPSPMGPPAQQPNPRFSSPISSIGEDDITENTESDISGFSSADLNDSGAHTSVSSVFGQPRVTADTHSSHQRQHAFQYPTARHEGTRASTIEEDFDGPVVGSLSPSVFSKRRAETHSAHVPAKRMRSSLHQVL
jgi:hypothetical protein